MSFANVMNSQPDEIPAMSPDYHNYISVRRKWLRNLECDPCSTSMDLKEGSLRSKSYSAKKVVKKTNETNAKKSVNELQLKERRINERKELRV